MDKKYVVYKFTNLINGKGYIGKSCRIERRYQEHLNGVVWRTTGKKSAISKAIAKYGIENFSFEILYSFDNPEEMNIAEMSSIKNHNTLSPNGYNFRCEIDGKCHVHEDTKQKLSKIGQGLRHAKKELIKSPYIGVLPCCSTKHKMTYRVCVRIAHKIKTKTFYTEIEAAEAYDKMVIYLYGKDARINFEDSRESYINENLDEFYNFFISSYIEKKSSYKGVSPYTRKCNRWVARVYVPFHKKKEIPPLSLGSFETEEEAAIMVDKINWYFGLSDEFNFPENIKTYDRNELELFFASKIYKKTSKYEGVSMKGNGKWRSYFYVNRKQVSVGDNFDTEEEAYYARQNEINRLEVNPIG